MKRISTLVLLMMFLISSPALAQEKTITGKVTSSSDGLGIPGATVIVKESPTTGTISDVNGDYAIQVPQDANVLVFSFVGFESNEVAIGTQTVINVVLQEETKLLEGVIITAIGIREEKKSLGYAAQEVTSDELNRVSQTNMINNLSSKVAGLEVTSTSGSPGASANIVIRGRTSLSGSNSPLFVVDGIPIDNDYTGSNFIDHSNRAIDLNSDDIESVTVLKGPAASALYGIRAANGAIIITTKRGGGKKTNITFSQSLAFDQVNKLPEKQMKYAQGKLNLLGNPVYFEPGSSVNTSWGPLIDTLRYDGDADYRWDENGKIVNMSDPAATSQGVEPYDNVEDFFQTGVTSNTHFSLSGGGKIANYYFSVGHLEQTGIIPNSTFSRTSMKITGDAELSDKLKISGSASYTNSGGDRMNRGSNLSGVMLGLLRTTPTFDNTNGLDNPVDNQDAYMFDDGTQRSYYPSYDNPYWSVNRNLASDEVNRLMGFTQIDYELLPWLKAVYRIGLDYYFEERKAYWDMNSNEYIDLGGFITDDLYSYRSVNSDFLLTAQRKLNDNFDLTAIIGHNYFAERTYNYITDGTGFVLPEFYDMSNVESVIADDDLDKYRIVGAFYNIKLAYKNYLYFTTTGRNDWTSTLAKGNNAFFYPSFNLGFIFTEPLNMEKNKYLSYGKLRLSYAEVGNDAPVYSLRDYYSNVDFVRGQLSYLTSTELGNPDLEPEKTRSWEGGFDLRFFQNRIGLDLTLYRTMSDGQILSVPIAYSTGYSTILANAGKIENKGIELQLRSSPIKKENFNWDFIINFGSNENTVVELAEGVADIRFESTGLASTSSRAIEGEPFGVIYGTKWMRNSKGDLLIDDEGYPIMDTATGIVGDPNPDWTLGIRNTISYKCFTLSFLVDIRQGGDIFNGTAGVMKSLGVHKETENRDEEVVIEGVYLSDGQPNTTAIKLNDDYYSKYPFAGVSEAGIEDGSWVRLREVAVSFRVPDKICKKIRVKSLHLGFSARNLLLITDYSGVDPETNLSGVSNSFGRDYFNSPNTKTYAFSLKVSL